MSPTAPPVLSPAPVSQRGGAASRVARSTVAQTLLTLAAAGLSVLVLHLSTAYLGAAVYGQVVAATALVAVLSALADGGLATLGAREMARRPDEAASILGITMALRSVAGLALMPVALGVAVLLYHSTPFTVTAVLVLSPALALGALQSSLGAVFVARGRNQVNAAIDTASLAAVLVGVKLVGDRHLGTTAYMLVLLGGYLVATASTAVLACGQVRQRPSISTRRARTLLVAGAPLGLVLVLNMVYLRLDSLLLSVLRAPVEVGRYGVAYRVVELMMAMPSLFMIALLPEIAAATPARARQLVQRALEVTGTVAVPVTVAVVVVAPAILDTLGGPAFVPAGAALRILAVGAGASYLGAVYGNALIAMGHQRRMPPLTVLVVVANLVLNLALIPFLGLEGAAVATTASELLALAGISRLFARHCGFRPALRGLRWPVVAGGGALLAGLLISHLPQLSATGVPALVLPSGAVVAAYLILLIPGRGLRPFAGVLRDVGRNLSRR
jgi:O-antigen/teichoic acid export membrane protein